MSEFDTPSPKSNSSGLKVSLVLATKGRAKEVDKFIQSLARQKYADLELIVLDQNEDDRLAPILENAKLLLPIVRLRSKSGLSHARNVGIASATGVIMASFLRSRVCAVVGPFDEELGVGARTRFGSGETISFGRSN
jgi:glycosyltransferase involved in cell wall biosynthesis